MQIGTRKISEFPWKWFPVPQIESEPAQVKIENTINNITVNVNRGGTKPNKSGPKKIIKNGKEFFVMTKQQVKLIS